MIKRIYLLTILLIVCLLTGCGNKTEKMCRIEIRNENSTEVITLEQQSWADVYDFFDFDVDEWTEYENFDEELVSEYVIELYQEKTHTRVQFDKENTYEKIMEYTTYKDSDMVKVVISKDAIKSGSVSEEYLTFYYKGSEQFFSALNNVLK
ncbi:MAG: hypothetical protein PUB98_02020 [Clostridiales bacterium]|nr:hypothetical protein [Clostridiales bacterium]